MTIQIDHDVVVAAELLQREFPASKLMSISKELARVAPVLWGRHSTEEVTPAVLTISSVAHTPTASK